MRPTTGRAPAGPVIDQLPHRDRLRTDACGRPRPTDAGEASPVRPREPAPRVRAAVHEGGGDERYVAALKVLRTALSNVEGV